MYFQFNPEIKDLQPRQGEKTTIKPEDSKIKGKSEEKEE